MDNHQAVLQRKPLVELLPPWILAGSGVIYATGFLVVLAFLDRFGIREAGADFWKTRYIHIGILCLAFPLILNGTILALAYLIAHGKFQRTTMWQRLFPIGLLVVNLEVVCFVLIMLTDRVPGGSSIAGMTPIRWILGVTLLGIPILLSVERVIERVAGGEPTGDAELKPAAQTFSIIGRWFAVVIVGCLDVWFVLDFRGMVSGGQPLLAFTYIAFSCLLGVMLSTVSAYERRQKEEERKKAIVVLFAAIAGPFFYLFVLSFSYGVFQNIPSTRGGGDFTHAPKIIVTLRNPAVLSDADNRYFNPGAPQTTIPLVLIEETTWAIYVADPSDGGGPAEWKTIGGRKPQILVLNKSDVVKLHSESRNSQTATP